MNRERAVSVLNKCCLGLFVMVILSAIYIMNNGLGLIDGLDFGPGQYYYTDIPNWQKYFFQEGQITANTNHPVLFMGLFIGWGLLMWKAWGWLDRKIK